MVILMVAFKIAILNQQLHYNVDNVSILEVLYKTENYLFFVQVSLTPKFWLMTCTSLGNFHLYQVLLSL